MFEEDYIMRVIKEMVRVLLKLLFHIDTESPSVELLEDAEEQAALQSLLDMVDAGEVNEAENRLYDMLNKGNSKDANANKNSLQLALLFYSYLNDKNDKFLEEHDYSRDEIKQGLEDIVSISRLGGITDMFLSDL